MDDRETKTDAVQANSTEGEVGDVETAGETTAAVAISGPPDNKPVGADTMLEIADAPKKSESGNQ